MTVVVQPLFVREFGDPLIELSDGGHGVSDYFRMRSLVDAGVPVVGSRTGRWPPAHRFGGSSRWSSARRPPVGVRARTNA